MPQYTGDLAPIADYKENSDYKSPYHQTVDETFRDVTEGVDIVGTGLWGPIWQLPYGPGFVTERLRHASHDWSHKNQLYRAEARDDFSKVFGKERANEWDPRFEKPHEFKIPSLKDYADRDKAEYKRQEQEKRMQEEEKQRQFEHHKMNERRDNKRITAREEVKRMNERETIARHEEYNAHKAEERANAWIDKREPDRF